MTESRLNAHGTGAAAQVQRFARRVARRLRGVAALDGALTLATVAFAVLLAGTAVKPAVTFFRYAPVVFAAVGLCALAWGAALLLRALLARVPLVRAARLVETRHPELRSDLTSALELARVPDADFARYGTSRPLVDALERRAAQGVAGLDPAAIAPAGPLAGRLWLPAALGAVTAAVAVVSPALLADSARALVNPLAFVPADTLVLDVSPGDATVLRGSPVTIRVRAAGRVPDRVEVALFAADAAARPDREPPPQSRLAARPAGDGLFVVGPFPAERSLGYRAQADGTASRTFRLTVEEAPEVGRIVATYHYPAYLAMTDRTVEGGTVEAYRGTEVRLAMTANKPIARARVVFDDGSAVPVEVDPNGDGTALAATFVVTGEGGYRVILTDRAGFDTPEPIRYEIRVIPDDAPTAEIASPATDLTVDQGDTVRVEWRASDDIALGRVDLVFEAGQGEQRIALARPRAGQRPTRLAGRHDWRLGTLGLPPGARVAYYVEARDTDVISGPKTGVSQTYYLQIRSREQDHEQLRADQREIADQLLDALGDQLEREAAAEVGRTAEAAEKGRALDERLDRVERQLEAALARAAEDPLADATQLFDLNLLRSHLGQVREEAARAGTDPARQPDVTRELEQLATFADEIGKRGEMQDLVRRGRELMEAQTGLLDRLEREKGKALDPKTRAELEQALRDIEAQLRKLAEQLARMPQSLPDEFVNSEAMNALEMQDMADALEQLREAIRQGDAEKARELARQLAQQLNQMMAALDGAQGESQQADAGGQQMARQMQRQQNRLQELAREQRDIVNRTEEIDRRAADRLAAVQQREWSAFEQRARQRLDQLAERSREAQRQAARQGVLDAQQYFQQRALQDAIRDARDRLDQRQAQALRQSLEGARDQLRRAPMLPEAAEEAAALDRLAQELARLGDASRTLTADEREQLRQLAERQRSVGQATEQLRQEMDDLAANLPMLGPQLGRALREAVPFMGEAQDRLGERDARGAVPPEREALKRLQRAQQAMRNAQQMMAQRGQMRGMSAPQMAGRQPGGMMMPDGQEGREGRMPRVDQRIGGRAGASTRDFKLPGRDDYQVPRVYREQVIEALKEPVPEAYRRKVERYFKNLTE
ncbi:MAG TPA: DUF4175 family protein [Thermodesulfobacteriota bacterium]